MASQSVESLRKLLHDAQVQLAKLSRRDTGSAQWRDAYDRKLSLERELAAAQGLEYAEAFDFELPWDLGAPLPHIVAAHRVFLVFYLRNAPRESWDGSSVTVVTPLTGAPVAVLEFLGIRAFKMGVPNDEALHGHPLFGRGLEAYRAHVVKQSSWIGELEHINSVHAQHRPGWHARLTHYIFCFHDETFECVATGYKAETRDTDLAKAVRDVTRLIDGT